MNIPDIKCKWVRSHKVKLRDLPQILKPSDAADIFRQMIGPDELYTREHFMALFLNRNNRVIGKRVISIGSDSTTIVNMKHLFAPALQVLAEQIIVGHNHPAGSLKPSEVDKAITKRIVKAGLLFGITLIDHIIIAEDDFYSFGNNGDL